MFKKSAIAFMTCLALAACSADQPHVIQTAGNSPEVTVKQGMATQIEMPDAERVQSVTVGNPALLTADKDADIVNLTAKDKAGETNLIVRARDADGHAKLYQYHVVVQAD